MSSVLLSSTMSYVMHVVFWLTDYSSVFAQTQICVILAGIDPLLWRQAKLDNPDPERLVPVPMVGFRELQRRLKHQEEETKLHQQRLDVSDFIALLSKHMYFKQFFCFGIIQATVFTFRQLLET